MKRHIPNGITLLNLLCGFLACIKALDGDARMAAYLIAAGALFDLLDGMVARMLGVSGELGKQLDSLADMVSFGVAPALIARELILGASYIQTGDITVEGWQGILEYAPMMLVAASAMRLAKFNIDTDQSVDFKGLPTPANALFWLSIPLSIDPGVKALGAMTYLQNPIVIAVLCIVMGLLLVSRMSLFSLKIDRRDKSRFVWQIVLVISALIGFVFFKFAALPFVIVLYLLLSLIKNTTKPHEIQS